MTGRETHLDRSVAENIEWLRQKYEDHKAGRVGPTMVSVVFETAIATLAAAVNDYDRLRAIEEAARATLAGWDAHQEANAGRGHEGPHEPDPILQGDCGPCTGALYGTEVEMGEHVIPALRSALAVKLREEGT